ncbi:MAG TPA: RNA polymerase factor sigma-54 [Acidiferrobacterales bacterium]
MKQSLDLKLGQHLTITPQLQQAIRLLQLSSLELQQEIQEALESNPLLEEIDEESGAKSESEGESLNGQSDDSATDNVEGDEPGDSGEERVQEDYAGEASEERVQEDYAGDAWEDTFDTPASIADRPGNRDDGLPDIDTRNSAPLTLRDHLLWQMQMTQFTPRDVQIAMALIDAINEDGYLRAGTEEIQQALGADDPVEADEIEAVLHQIQNFDPIGVGARSLSECLLLQLKAMDADIPYLEEARLLARSEHLDLLAARDFKALRRVMKLKPEDLQPAITLIQHLNPRPGSSIQANQASYITPDIVVKKFRGVWRAELNGHVTPRLRINNQYERLIQRGKDSADNKYLQERLQEARWFLKSLSSRNDTLLKVARAIVDRQRAFFDHGPEAMKPLVLHDIAEVVEMHESTISRVTTNKYMLTPRGIFELKYFFSSHVSTADGGTCSATAIRSLIKKMIEEETTTKPISDSRIAELLAEQGIYVARRTVAKYRESLNIPPSSQRKSLV